MNVLSLFDGISCGRVALDRAGLPVDRYYASEVDKWAIKVSEDNYPDILRLGDVTKWREWDIDWSSVDLILAGSPCQGFSFAGKQLAFEDTRSKLFFIFVEILNHVRGVNPDVKFLLENVRMKKEFLDIISESLEELPEVINSSLVSAQNRVRYYWANWDFGQPQDKGEVILDILDEECMSDKLSEDGCSDSLKFLAGIESGRRLDDGKNLSRNFREGSRVYCVKGKSATPTAQSKGGKGGYSGLYGVRVSPVVGAQRGRYLVDGVRQDGKMKTAGKTRQYIELRYDGKSNCLTTVPKDNKVVLGGHDGETNRYLPGDLIFRSLTPLECERLQTLPDNYTKAVSNSQRFKALGNGWTVDVIAHILRGLHDRNCS